MNNSRLIERMQALLAMANDKSSEHEAAIAMRRLHSLLSKHNISISELEASTEKEDVGEVEDSYRCRPWRRIVARAIAQLYFCDMYYRKVGSNKSLYIFAGTEVNRTFALSIFNMVTSTLEREARSESRKVYGEVVSSFRSSFLNSAAHRISQRCVEMIEQAEAGLMKDEAGTTLPAMLSTYENHRKQVEEYLSRYNIRTKSARTTYKDMEGVRAGKAAGDRAQLSRGIHADNSPTLIGN